QFDWTVPTDGQFTQKGALGAATFEWPVDMDLGNLITDLPAEIVSAQAGHSADGAAASFVFAEGVTPRFYAISPSQYVLDIDIAGQALPALTPTDLSAEAERRAAEEAAAAEQAEA